MARKRISKKTIVEYDNDAQSVVSDISSDEINRLTVEDDFAIKEEYRQSTRSPDTDHMSTNPPSMPNTRRRGRGGL